MKKEIISTNNAPEAIGPYSQAVKVGSMIYTSGQIPINPKTGEMVSDSIEEEARQAMENLKAVLEAAGSGLNSVIKTTLYIKDMNCFAAVNGVYSQYFKAPFPARSCVEVARLPKDAGVEIEAVAIIE